MKLSYVFLLAISSLLFSCGSDQVDLAIDNPTEEAIIVTIDSLVVEVPARQVVWVEMGKGKHQIKLADNTVSTFDFTQSMYMLNPTLTEYLMFEQMYGEASLGGFMTGTLPHTTVTYLGSELEGNYKVISDLVNLITWDYGPREDLPEVVQMDEDESYTSLIKLMDPIELINQAYSEEQVLEEAEVTEETQVEENP